MSYVAQKPDTSKINQEHLCYSAKNGDLNLFKYLCSFLDGNGKSAEYKMDIAGYGLVNNMEFDNYVICHACEYGHVDIVRFILDNYSHVINIKANDGYSLYFACTNQHIEVVKLIFNKYCHIIDFPISDDFTPFCLACELGLYKLFDFIINNYNVNVAYNNNHSIKKASICGYDDIVCYLVDLHLEKILKEGLDMKYVNRIKKILEVKDKKLYDEFMLELKHCTTYVKK